jgi:hypothetical protein
VVAISTPYFFVGFQPCAAAFLALALASAFALVVELPTTVPFFSIILYGLGPFPRFCTWTGMWTLSAPASVYLACCTLYPVLHGLLRSNNHVEDHLIIGEHLETRFIQYFYRVLAADYLPEFG